MVQLSLLDFAQKQFPDLDFDRPEDIIKVEKILKAEAKLDPKIKINDIENLLSFLKTYKGQFIPILKNKNVMSIIDGKEKNINFAPFDRTGISDQTLNAFQEAFSTNTLDYIKLCIRISAWARLKSIFLHYTFLLSDQIRDDVFQIFSLKNQATISAIHHNQYISFTHSNGYSVDPGYYGLLSVMSSHYFDEEILDINNIISQKQRNSPQNKVYLGKILYAATFFEAYSDSLRTTLESNQEIALLWTYPDKAQSSSSSMSTFSIVAYALLVVVALIAFIAVPGATFPIIGVGGIIFRLIRAANR